MSTGLNCEIVKYQGKWYYILEDWGAPKNAWDWHEYARAYGPFPSEDAAERHLGACHANPGGTMTEEYEGDDRPSDAVMALLGDATRRA